jgi:hypothetical protein
MYMVTDKLKELETARAHVAQLEAAIADEMGRELAALPSRYGYADTKAFIKAVRKAAREGAGPGRSAKTTGKRARITDEIRTKVRKMIEDGKQGKAIATAVGISLPSVQNIKKALGLVKKRG